MCVGYHGGGEGKVASSGKGGPAITSGQTRDSLCERIGAEAHLQAVTVHRDSTPLALLPDPFR